MIFSTTSLNNEIIHQLLYGGAFAVFFILIVVFIALTAVLNYHWTSYDVKIPGIKAIRWVYVAVSLIFFFGMGLTLIFIIW
ncbi:MAG: hypothetical protein EXS52_01300 [Candidatus Staskawiczbacteria bacterium]|nr:hypothetical protein [Candidatus Staskawiczbacteria bacterium]